MFVLQLSRSDTFANISSLPASSEINREVKRTGVFPTTFEGAREKLEAAKKMHNWRMGAMDAASGITYSERTSGQKSWDKPREEIEAGGYGSRPGISVGRSPAAVKLEEMGYKDGEQELLNLQLDERFQKAHAEASTAIDGLKRTYDGVKKQLDSTTDPAGRRKLQLLMDDLAYAANVAASVVLKEEERYTLWGAKDAARKGRFEQQAGRTSLRDIFYQLVDANSYLAHESLAGFYNVQYDSGGRPEYLTNAAHPELEKYYSYINLAKGRMDSLGKAGQYEKLVENYAYNLGQFEAYFNRAVEKETSWFQYSKSIREAPTGIEKICAVASPFVEAASPVVAALSMLWPQTAILGYSYFSAQSIKSFQEGDYLHGGLMALTLAAPIFSSMTGSGSAFVSTAGKVGSVSSKGAGLFFMVDIGFSTGRLLIDGSKYGFSVEQMEELGSSLGFIAMPAVVHTRLAKVVPKKEPYNPVEEAPLELKGGEATSKIKLKIFEGADQKNRQSNEEMYSEAEATLKDGQKINIVRVKNTSNKKQMRVFDGMYSLLERNFRESEIESKDDYLNFIQDAYSDNFFVNVAYDLNGRVIGVGTYSYLGKISSIMGNVIAVDPGYRNLGLGQALLDFRDVQASKHAKNLGSEIKYAIAEIDLPNAGYDPPGLVSGRLKFHTEATNVRFVKTDGGGPLVYIMPDMQAYFENPSAGKADEWLIFAIRKYDGGNKISGKEIYPLLKYYYIDYLGIECGFDMQHMRQYFIQTLNANFSLNIPPGASEKKVERIFNKNASSRQFEFTKPADWIEKDIEVREIEPLTRRGKRSASPEAKKTKAETQTKKTWPEQLAPDNLNPDARKQKYRIESNKKIMTWEEFKEEYYKFRDDFYSRHDRNEIRLPEKFVNSLRNRKALWSFVKEYDGGLPAIRKRLTKEAAQATLETKPIQKHETFSQEGYDFLFGRIAHPLFDITEPQTGLIYRELQNEVGPQAISRDITSWTEIQTTVLNHVSKYGDNALIVIEGAAPHIWGAIPMLEKEAGCKYIQAPTLALALNKGLGDAIGKVDPERLAVQMTRDLGVVKYLGARDIEHFINERNAGTQNRNLIIGMEETGLHGLYTTEHAAGPYEDIIKYVREYSPKSVLYIHEDLNVENIKSGLNRYKETGQLGSGWSILPRDKFLATAIDLGVPVEFGAFGFLDRQNLQNAFGVSSLFGWQKFPYTYASMKVKAETKTGETAPKVRMEEPQGAKDNAEASQRGKPRGMVGGTAFTRQEPVRLDVPGLGPKTEPVKTQGDFVRQAERQVKELERLAGSVSARMSELDVRPNEKLQNCLEEINRLLFDIKFDVQKWKYGRSYVSVSEMPPDFAPVVKDVGLLALNSARAVQELKVLASKKPGAWGVGELEAVGRGLQDLYAAANTGKGLPLEVKLPPIQKTVIPTAASSAGPKQKEVQYWEKRAFELGQPIEVINEKRAERSWQPLKVEMKMKEGKLVPELVQDESYTLMVGGTAYGPGRPVRPGIWVKNPNVEAAPRSWEFGPDNWVVDGPDGRAYIHSTEFADRPRVLRPDGTAVWYENASKVYSGAYAQLTKTLVGGQKFVVAPIEEGFRLYVPERLIPGLRARFGYYQEYVMKDGALVGTGRRMAAGELGKPGK